MVNTKSWSRNIIVLLSLALCSVASGEERVTVVAGLNGQKCRAYLRLPDERQGNVPLAFAVGGSGLYTVTEGWMPFRIDNMKEVASLSIDKPGILPNRSFLGFEFNEKEVARYTLPDLIECALNAILWARTQDGVSTDSTIFLLGHSEGAIVVTRLYQKMLLEDAVLAGKIRALVLAGTPLDPLKETFEANFSRKPELKQDFLNAYAKRDDSWLVENMGFGSAWLDDAFRAEPLNKTLENLAALHPHALFSFYQGLDDQSVSAASVKKFEMQNAARREAGEASLRMTAEYFKGGHTVVWPVIESVQNRLRACLSREDCGLIDRN